MSFKFVFLTIDKGTKKPKFINTTIKLEEKLQQPSSFLLKPSTITPSLNLYVSQQTTTGTLFVFAIMATIAVPAREYTAPLELRECAPIKTMVTSVRSDGRAGSSAYVHGIGFGPRVRAHKSVLPAKEDRSYVRYQKGMQTFQQWLGVDYNYREFLPIYLSGQ